MDVGREQWLGLGTADKPAVSVDLTDSNGLACILKYMNNYIFSKILNGRGSSRVSRVVMGAEVASLNRKCSIHKASPIVGRTKSVHCHIDSLRDTCFVPGMRPAAERQVHAHQDSSESSPKQSKQKPD